MEKKSKKQDARTAPKRIPIVAAIGMPAVSPDGSVVAYSCRGSIFAMRATGGRPKRLTKGPGDAQPLWSPLNDGTLIFKRTISDDKGVRVRIFMHKPDRAAVIPVTPEFDKSPAELRFMPAGRGLSFIASADEEKKEHKENAVSYPHDEKPQRLWTMSLKSGRPRIISPPGVCIWEYDWLPDGKSAVVIFSDEARRDKHAQYFSSKLGILKQGRLTPLHNLEYGGRFKLSVSPDGAHIAFIRSPIISIIAGSAWVLHIDTGRTTCVMPAKKNHVESFEWLADGSGLVLQVADGMETNLYTVSLDKPGKPRRVGAGLPSSVHHGFQVSKNAVFATAEGVRRPPELWRADLNGKRVMKLTSLNQRTANGIRWARRKVIRWRSVNNFEIEGILTLPPGYRRGRRYPAIVIVHGGPCSRHKLLSGLKPQDVISPQSLAERGYALLEPNIRGSTGYGDEFLQANVKDWGGGDFSDIMSGIDRLVRQGIADPRRLAIYGASYGGFMTNWAVTQTNRFAAAVSLCGASDHLSKYYTADISPGFPDRYFGKPSPKQRKLLWERSPIAHAGKAKTPTLILHGEKDNRVPVSQGYEMYKALLYAGVETELVIYPKRAHSLACPDAFERTLAWLDRHLKQSSASMKKR